MWRYFTTKGVLCSSVTHFCPPQYVTDLGDKDMMIGYTFLHDHNPDIDWEKGEWRFTRCPETCADRLRKSRRVYEADEVNLDDDDC